MLTNHRQLFSEQQLDTVRSSISLSLKRAWLRNITSARRYQTRHYNQSIPQMRSLMRNYLGLQPETRGIEKKKIAF